MSSLSDVEKAMCTFHVVYRKAEHVNNTMVGRAIARLCKGCDEPLTDAEADAMVLRLSGDAVDSATSWVLVIATLRTQDARTLGFGVGCIRVHESLVSNEMTFSCLRVADFISRRQEIADLIIGRTLLTNNPSEYRYLYHVNTINVPLVLNNKHVGERMYKTDHFQGHFDLFEIRLDLNQAVVEAMWEPVAGPLQPLGVALKMHLPTGMLFRR